MIFDKNSLSFSEWSSKSWQTWTWWACWSLVIRCGTNFAAMRCIFNSSVKMWWQEPTEIPHSSASSLTNQMLIRSHQSVDFINVWVISWCGRTSRAETFMPPETCRSLHGNITVSHVKHGKRFCSRFSQLDTKFHTKSLLFQVIHFEKNL